MVRTTPKAMAVGAELRAARAAAELSLRALAKQLSIDHSVLSRYESGERSPGPEEVAAILAVLGVTGVERDRIVELSRDTSGSTWVAVGLPEQRSQLAALLDLEHLATNIISVSPLLVPGLLQTSSYARAIMRAADVPADEVETRVAVRVGRREALLRKNPVHFTAVIDEAVLQRRIGTPHEMAEQLDHLLQMSKRPNVELRVIARDGWHPGLEGPFTILRSASTSVVHLENRRSGMFLHDDEDLAAYERAAEMVLSVTMGPQETAELIVRAAERIGSE